MKSHETFEDVCRRLLKSRGVKYSPSDFELKDFVNTYEVLKYYLKKEDELNGKKNTNIHITTKGVDNT